jgi:hypothetical protein
MRNTVIACSVAVVALAGVAGGVVSASDPGVAPNAPPSSIPGLDIFGDLDLDSEQLQCLAESAGSLDITDLASLPDLLAQCGKPLDELLQFGDEPVATDEIGPTATAGEAVTPSDIDAAAAAAALGLFGLDEETVACLVAEAATATPDDQSAELALFNCEVGLGRLLAGIIALEAAASGTDPAATTATVERATATEPPMSDPLLDALLEGLDPEQAQCVRDVAPDLDLSDLAAVNDVVATCGIDLLDLLPGG